MPAYATNSDFEAYVEGWVTDDPAALTRLLERATSDVDEVLGPLPYIQTGTYAGRKIDPASLLDHERAALARATCAQAEHRWRYLEPATKAATADQRQVKQIKGPDFETTYGDGTAAPGVTGTGRFDPRLPAELAPLARIRRLRARAVA